MFGAQYDMPGGVHMLAREGADVMSRNKRLTDEQLAAEYWRLRLKVCASGNKDMRVEGHVCREWREAHDELDVMQRFMELPHYDD
jgi:hypothetical protein